MWIKEKKNMDICGFLIFWENIMRKDQNGQEKIAILELAHPGGRELKKSLDFFCPKYFSTEI